LGSLVLPKPGPAQEKGSSGTPAKWEYKIVSEKEDEKTFNGLGAEGWELSGVVPGVGSNPMGQITTSVSFVFKRPKRIRVNRSP
jgi:hypothetical protein